ncbi:MAG: hypothetical protein V2A65_01345 [Candidatus Omnitrophota bacterium]
MSSYVFLLFKEFSRNSLVFFGSPGILKSAGFTNEQLRKENFLFELLSAKIIPG